MTRKEELQRERNLVASHLAWLDLELARLEGEAPKVSENPAPKPAAAPLPVPRTDALPEDPMTEQLIQQQTESSSKSVSEAKRGCFLVFAAALLILGSAVFLGYWLKYRH